MKLTGLELALFTLNHSELLTTLRSPHLYTDTPRLMESCREREFKLAVGWEARVQVVSHIIKEGAHQHILISSHRHRVEGGVEAVFTSRLLGSPHHCAGTGTGCPGQPVTS